MIEISVKAKLSKEDVQAIAKEVAVINNPKNLQAIAKDQEKQYTVKEVAEMTNRTCWTVRQHITVAKILTANKVGKSFLISESNYKKYINNEQ